MFEQSEEEQMPCVMCGQHNEQMLMLGCEHDPCINCASIHYSENQPYNSAVIESIHRYMFALDVDKKPS